MNSKRLCKHDWVGDDHCPYCENEDLKVVAQLASELCDAVDEDAEDIGGHRPVHVILGELGPAVDKVMPR